MKGIKNFWVDRRRIMLCKKYVHEVLMAYHHKSYMKRTPGGSTYWDTGLLELVVDDLVSSHSDLDEVTREDVDNSVTYHTI